MWDKIIHMGDRKIPASAQVSCRNVSLANELNILGEIFKAELCLSRNRV